MNRNTNMTPEAFCYWLQGYFEMTEGTATLSPKQVEMIQNHLNLVFEKVTPNQAKLKKLLLESEEPGPELFRPEHVPFNPDVICQHQPPEITKPTKTHHKPGSIWPNGSGIRYC